MNLIIALDLESLQENLTLIKTLDSIKSSHTKIWVKIGLRAFVRDGIAGIEAIKKACDFPIFLDLKLYDIPNTMADAVQECAKIGIDMLTIHASAGKRAMQEIMARLEMLDSSRDSNQCKQNSKNKNNTSSNIKKPLIMAVSALTSFSEEEFSEVYHKEIATSVMDFAKMSANSNINGMVCSVQECALIKKAYPNLLTLTPAIRPKIQQDFSHKDSKKDSKDDQRRVASIQDAYNAGADFIVIGRSIYRASSPQNALQSILSQMQNLSNA